MSEFAYIAKEPAASDVTTPTGWPDGWTVPTSASGPWPPGFPHTPAATYTLEMTINDWLYAGGPMSLTVRTLLSGANTSALNGELIETSAAIGATPVQVKKESTDSFANQVYHRVTNYSGAAYGFSDSIILDLDSGDDGSTVTVTSTVVSTSTEFTGTDTIVASNPIGVLMSGLTSVYVADVDEFGFSPNVWVSATSLTTNFGYGAGGSVTGKSYRYGGVNNGSVKLQETHEIIVTADTNAIVGFLPTPARSGNVGFSFSSKCYSLGGTTGTFQKDCDELTPSTSVWASKTDMPTPVRASAAGCAIGVKGYVFCGLTTGPASVQDCDEFDGTSWTSKTDAPVPARWGGAGGTISTKGYIFGGDDGAAVQDNDEFDQSGNSWASKTSLPTPARAYNSGFDLSTTVLSMGGNYPSNIQDCDSYSSGTDTWTAKTDIPAPARSYASGAAA